MILNREFIFKHFSEFVQVDHLSNLIHFVIPQKLPKNPVNVFFF